MSSTTFQEKKEEPNQKLTDKARSNLSELELELVSGSAFFKPADGRTYLIHINPDPTLGYQRKYPRFSSVRLSHGNISRIKARASRYNQTIDDLMTIILGQLDYYEKLGYPDATRTDGGSF